MMARGDVTRSKQDQFSLRFPDGLRDQIKVAAAASGRSMNTEIILRLEASFEPGRELTPAIARAIEDHVNAEVARRLREVAAKLGGDA